jgi:dGTPase
LKKPCPRELSERAEKALSEHATRSAGANATRSHAIDPDDFRTEFERDYTRIIHCKAFRRLRHKTQVFLSPEDDHISTRIEHSLQVASISKTLARALNLNENLVLAIAIGHDLGHAPFGHIGEEILDKLAKEHLNSHFWHEEHSLRLVDELENVGYKHRGLNLTRAVRDGIACHYGESFPPELSPDRNKAENHILRERKEDLPCTLEGCVVRCVDIISYLGRDLEDGLDVGLIKPDDIPTAAKNRLGETNTKIIDTLVRDIYANYEKDDRPDKLRFSSDVAGAAQELKAFNDEHIYQSGLVTRRKNILRVAMKLIFGELVAVIDRCNGDIEAISCQATAIPKRVLKTLHDFIKEDLKTDGLKTKNGVKKCALYFIAGMTDNYFLETFHGMFRSEV